MRRISIIMIIRTSKHAVKMKNWHTNCVWMRISWYELSDVIMNGDPWPARLSCFVASIITALITEACGFIVRWFLCFALIGSQQGGVFLHYFCFHWGFIILHYTQASFQASSQIWVIYCDAALQFYLLAQRVWGELCLLVLCFGSVERHVSTRCSGTRVLGFLCRLFSGASPTERERDMKLTTPTLDSCISEGFSSAEHHTHTHTHDTHSNTHSLAHHRILIQTLISSQSYTHTLQQLMYVSENTDVFIEYLK